MKNIRQLISVIVLTVVLSGSAFAGDLWIPGLVGSQPTGDGTATNCPSTVEVTAIDPFHDAAVLLCQSMLSIF